MGVLRTPRATAGRPYAVINMGQLSRKRFPIVGTGVFDGLFPGISPLARKPGSMMEWQHQSLAKYTLRKVIEVLSAKDL